MLRTFTYPSCPKHVEAFYENKIIVNCCIKLVHLLSYIYDARSHLHQKPTYF